MCQEVCGEGVSVDQFDSAVTWRTPIQCGAFSSTGLNTIPTCHRWFLSYDVEGRTSDELRTSLASMHRFSVWTAPRTGERRAGEGGVVPEETHQPSVQPGPGALKITKKGLPAIRYSWYLICLSTWWIGISTAPTGEEILAIRDVEIMHTERPVTLPRNQ